MERTSAFRVWPGDGDATDIEIHKAFSFDGVEIISGANLLNNGEFSLIQGSGTTHPQVPCERSWLDHFS